MAGRHSKSLKSLYPDISIAFADTDREKAALASSAIKGSVIYDDPDQAFETGSFDIAFITTPHAYHSGLAVQAAKAGKDIIIEKPVTRNSKELAAVMSAVKKSGVRCTVAENYMFKPVIPKVKKMIEAGAIGEPLMIQLNKTGFQANAGWRLDPVMMGGGALLEGGVHWVNILVTLADSVPEAIIAFVPEKKYDMTSPFEDTISLTVRFKNGMTASLLHSWKIPNSLKGISLSKIYGTEGTITFESNGLFAMSTGRKRCFSAVNPANLLGFKSMHRHLIESWKNGTRWEPSMDRVKMELAMIEAAYSSLRTKKMEKIL
jgi:predicted dehydrogenase